MSAEQAKQQQPNSNGGLTGCIGEGAMTRLIGKGLVHSLCTTTAYFKIAMRYIITHKHIAASYTLGRQKIGNVQMMLISRNTPMRKDTCNTNTLDTYEAPKVVCTSTRLCKQQTARLSQMLQTADTASQQLVDLASCNKRACGQEQCTNVPTISHCDVHRPTLIHSEVLQRQTWQYEA